LPPTLHVSPFDPDTCDQTSLDQYYALMTASAAIDRPNDRRGSPEAVIGRMRTRTPGDGERLHWAASWGDALTGFMSVNLPPDENGGFGGAEITVHPDFRRRGTATALLRVLLSVLRDRGRAGVEGWWIVADGVGEHWALRRGFRRTHATVSQTLSLDETDVTRWAAETPTGYRTVRWMGHTPEDLVVSYALARSAIQDAPLGDAHYQEPDWTVERIRAAEAEQREHGIEQRVVVAVHKATGTVAGLTELALYPGHDNVAHQRDTAVLAAHRGHGLGLHLKACMAEWLHAEHPEIRRIVTSTGAGNSNMIRVNTTLGFVTSNTWVVLSGDVDSLSNRLGEAGHA
jgi:mycothiol synthase